MRSWRSFPKRKSATFCGGRRICTTFRPRREFPDRFSLPSRMRVFSITSAKRTELPSQNQTRPPVRVVNESLLDLFRKSGNCENCTKWCDRREPHHHRGRGQGAMRIDLAINLVALCLECHHSAHFSSDPSRAKLLAIIAKREKRTEESINLEMAILRKKSRKDPDDS